MVMLLFANGISFAKGKPEKKKEEKKNYFKATIGMLGTNLTIWTYDWYIRKWNWANISLDSISRNFKKGFIWDNNSFKCNQFEHPVHGAYNFTAGRISNLSFWESAPLSPVGSFVWEFMLENNRPSTNDQMFSGFGGPLLGEPLFRIAKDLVIDESSSGIQRIFRETLAFVVNPVVGVDRLITGKSFKVKCDSEKHYYDLELPIGFYGRNFMVKVDLEYKDALEKNTNEMNPYDYFTFNFKAGRGLKDKEVITIGILFGKRTRKGLFGVFGHFDYIDYDDNIIARMSIIGLGPGLVANFKLSSDSYFNLFGIISGGFAGSSSLFPSVYGKDFFTEQGETYEFGRGGSSYHLGPGIKANLGLEIEKENLGRVIFGFAQYWLSSIFLDTDEFFSILSLDLRYNLAKGIQLNTGVDYYLRNALYKDLHLTRTKAVLRNSIVFKL